jgi:hypothetical protein
VTTSDFAQDVQNRIRIAAQSETAPGGKKQDTFSGIEKRIK